MVDPIRQSITVTAPPERAFTVFTERMGSWWPLDRYSIGGGPAVDAVVEPREGGRWFERAADGSECDWGRVLVWEPPQRLVLTWEISADWKPDPTLRTELELRFLTADDGGTKVELEHRNLDVYAEQAEMVRRILASPDGWAGLMRRYAELASAEAGVA